MSSKCYKTLTKPHTYIKSTRSGYKSVTHQNNHFMAQAQSVEFTNKSRDLYAEIPEAEFDAVWDRFTALCTDIDIEADDNVFQAGSRLEERVKAAREII